VLPTEVAEAVIGWATAEQHAGPAELQQAVVPLLESWRAKREAELVDRWREEAGRNGRAVSGWSDTLQAASDARVDTLLYQGGVQRDAFRCPACGRAAIEALTCPLDGTRMEPRDDGLDLAVRLTVSNGGDVWAVEHRRDLDPVEGIGALLRF
jgi:peptide subunit release factor 1 (eRF1)